MMPDTVVFSDPVSQAAVRADLLRRAGRFEEANETARAAVDQARDFREAPPDRREAIAVDLLDGDRLQEVAEARRSLERSLDSERPDVARIAGTALTYAVEAEQVLVGVDDPYAATLARVSCHLELWKILARHHRADLADSLSLPERSVRLGHRLLATDEDWPPLDRLAELAAVLQRAGCRAEAVELGRATLDAALDDCPTELGRTLPTETLDALTRSGYPYRLARLAEILREEEMPDEAQRAAKAVLRSLIAEEEELDDVIDVALASDDPATVLDAVGRGEDAEALMQLAGHLSWASRHEQAAQVVERAGEVLAATATSTGRNEILGHWLALAANYARQCLVALQIDEREPRDTWGVGFATIVGAPVTPGRTAGAADRARACACPCSGRKPACCHLAARRGWRRGRARTGHIEGAVRAASRARGRRTGSQPIRRLPAGSRDRIDCAERARRRGPRDPPPRAGATTRSRDTSMRLFATCEVILPSHGEDHTPSMVDQVGTLGAVMAVCRAEQLESADAEEALRVALHRLPSSSAATAFGRLIQNLGEADPRLVLDLIHPRLHLLESAEVVDRAGEVVDSDLALLACSLAEQGATVEASEVLATAEAAVGKLVRIAPLRYFPDRHSASDLSWFAGSTARRLSTLCDRGWARDELCKLLVAARYWEAAVLEVIAGSWALTIDDGPEVVASLLDLVNGGDPHPGDHPS